MRIKKIILVFSLFVISAMIFTACTTNGENSTSDKRLGNTNYNISNGGRVDVENGWIYYSLDDGLYKCKEDGTKKIKIFESEGGVYHINVVDDWVYFNNIGVYRIKTDGTCYEQLAGEDVRGGLHLVDGKIYNSSEYRMDFDGKNKDEIYNMNVASGYSLNIVDGYIYFYDKEVNTNEDKIFKMKLDGSELQAIYDGRTDYMIVDGDWIYYENYKNGDLYKMKTDSTEQQLIVEGTIRGIIECDGYIYYVSDGCIYKIKTDGTENHLLIDVDDNCPPEIQLHGEWLYYEKDKNLYRIKTDGTENQLIARTGEVQLDDKLKNSTANNETSIKNITLDRSYTMKFGKKNAVTYPNFTISYPSNWQISKQEVNSKGETITLSNKRGVEIKYSHIGGVPKGTLDRGGSAVSMSRVEVSKVAESKFVPGYVQGTNHSDLGKFVIAKLKVTGTLNMKTDSDFKDIDGSASFAVIPESKLGTDDSVRHPYESEFAFWYSDYISLIADAPDGKFTKEEEEEVISILSSFKNEDK